MSGYTSMTQSLRKLKKKEKFTTKFDPAPYKVIEVKGSMVTATRNERDITRNVSSLHSTFFLLKECT